jgi:ribosomal-protein-alanine N-acetyltransferase
VPAPGSASPPPELKPSPVELRPLRPEDRDEYLAAMRASRALHRPWIKGPQTVEDFERLLARTRVENSDFSVAEVRADRAIAGCFHLSQIVRGPLQQAFLGYSAVIPYAGRGYMSAGMQLLLRRAFVELKLHRIEANIQPGNDASIALVGRAGFVKEGFSERYLKLGGRWRDHERWAINVELWRAQRRAPKAS